MSSSATGSSLRLSWRLVVLGVTTATACSLTLPPEDEIFGEEDGLGGSVGEGGQGAPSTCDNGEKDGGETELDCGGSCAPCEVEEDPCANSELDGDETEVDCGGSCAPCEAEDPCENSVLDGDESDVDCGGSCAPCEVNDICGDPSDCKTEVCTSGLCAWPMTCSDDMMNETETDIDCGGLCQPCLIGQTCAEASDCEVLPDHYQAPSDCLDAFCTLLCSDGTNGCRRFRMVDSQVVMEAENYDHERPSPNSFHAWTEFTDETQVITGLECTPESTTEWTTQSVVQSNAPRVDYRVEFTSTGTFYFWVRAAGSGFTSDSVHLGMDGIVSFPNITTSSDDTYDWRGGSLTVERAGLHLVHLWAREDSARVDKIVINKSDVPPDGDGPPQSTRN